MFTINTNALSVLKLLKSKIALITYLKFIIVFCFATIECNYLLAQSKLVDTLYFDIGISKLTESQKLKVSGWFGQVDLSTDFMIDLTGYTDFVGTSSSNVDLSIDRARQLSIYCQTLGVDEAKTSVSGSGEMDSTIVGNIHIGIPSHRMVVFKFYTKSEPQIMKVADITYSDLQIGNHLVLDELNFHPGKHNLIPKSIPALKGLLMVLKDNPTLEVEIQGHICCGANRKEPDGLDLSTGKMNLSTSRAENIYNFLVKNGIKSTRLSYKGYGFTMPQILPEISSQDQQRNRRVELRVVNL